MTERLEETNPGPDYSSLPILDPYAGILPDRRLTVLSTNPSTHALIMAEKERADRIEKNQLAAKVEGWIRDQRALGMEERREMPVQKEIAA